MKARLKLRLRRQVPALAAAMFGLAWFGYVAGGLKIVTPAKMDWLFVSDWGAHQVGWLFFRGDRWSFPLGSVHSVLYPVGSTLGYSDSIPLLGIIGKILGPLLPRDFQYIGLWLASCFMLQGFVGAKVSAILCKNSWAAACGGALFATSPTLVLRVQHPSLCAHWLLLALIGLHLKLAPDRRAVRAAALLTMLTATIHPYLAIMMLVLSLALLLRVKLIGVLTWRGVATRALGFAVGLGLVFWILGYVGTGANVKANGFDYYSTDLDSLFNPMGFSRYFKELPHAPGAYEGLAYVGAGVVGLTIIAVFLGLPRWVRRARWRAVVPLAVGCVLLAMLAQGSNVRWNGQEVLNLGSLYEHVQIVAYAFRSTGRFIWPLHYFCFVVALGGAAAAFRPRSGTLAAVLFVALVVQATEINVQPARDRFKWSDFQKPKDPTWNLAIGDYEHIAIYPPLIYGSLCGADFDDFYVYRLSYVAYRLGFTINSGYVARYSDKLNEICRASEIIFQRGADPRTIYVPARGREMPSGTVVCGPLDGFTACVAAGRSTRFSRAIGGK